VKEPVRLLPESLTQEAAMLRAKRQGFAIERALVQANIDAWENTGCAKTVRRFKDRYGKHWFRLYATINLTIFHN
jgi:hypothetical protein